jgi:hypothetical protein
MDVDKKKIWGPITIIALVDGEPVGVSVLILFLRPATVARDWARMVFKLFTSYLNKYNVTERI